MARPRSSSRAKKTRSRSKSVKGGARKSSVRKKVRRKRRSSTTKGKRKSAGKTSKRVRRKRRSKAGKSDKDGVKRKRVKKVRKAHTVLPAKRKRQGDANVRPAKKYKSAPPAKPKRRPARKVGPRFHMSEVKDWPKPPKLDGKELKFSGPRKPTRVKYGKHKSAIDKQGWEYVMLKDPLGKRGSKRKVYLEPPEKTAPWPEPLSGVEQGWKPGDPLKTHAYHYYHPELKCLILVHPEAYQSTASAEAKDKKKKKKELEDKIVELRSKLTIKLVQGYCGMLREATPAMKKKIRDFVLYGKGSAKRIREMHKLTQPKKSPKKAPKKTPSKTLKAN